MRYNMKLEDQVLLSFYQDISPLADNPRIMLVRHVETGQIYVRKKLSLENREIYRLLQTQQVSGIPRIHLLVETEQELIIIEEYISGLSLDAYLQKEGVLNEKDAIYVMLQLCRTLQALHSFQPPLIHRDIKPSNVILTADMRAILIDFDAAKTYSKQKQRYGSSWHRRPRGTGAIWFSSIGCENRYLRTWYPAEFHAYQLPSAAAGCLRSHRPHHRNLYPYRSR